jgi:hypothetical protein
VGFPNNLSLLLNGFRRLSATGRHFLEPTLICMTFPCTDLGSRYGGGCYLCNFSNGYPRLSDAGQYFVEPKCHWNI